MEITTNGRPGIGQILKDAFSYWSRSLSYQLLFSLLFFSVIFLVSYYSTLRLGLMEPFIGAMEKFKVSREAYLQELRRLSATPDFQKFYWITTATLVFLYPLNFGLFKIYRKMDLGEKLDMQDLFAGYLGSNFFVYTSFFLFWLMIYNLLASTVFLAVIWVFITLFCGPLMFFMNKRIFEGISLSIAALKKYPLEIIICAVAAFFVRYSGFFTIVGALFTFPVWTAVIYALYKNIFSENESPA